MNLRGQAVARRPGGGADADAGYAMAALLVALSIMGILASAAMPVWKTMAKREKEEEFLFRAGQYARAIELFQRKMPGALPPNVDILVEQKFLRKKFKDPITNDDFVLVTPSQATLSAATPGATAGGAQSRRTAGRGPSGGRDEDREDDRDDDRADERQGSGRAGRGGTATGGLTTGGGLSGRGGQRPGGTSEGIIGVTSKSRERSLRTYNGRNRYNEWIVQYVPRVQAPGAGAPGTSAPGTTGPGGGRGSQTPGGRGVQSPGGRGPSRSGPRGPTGSGSRLFPQGAREGASPPGTPRVPNP